MGVGGGGESYKQVGVNETDDRCKRTDQLSFYADAQFKNKTGMPVKHWSV